MNQRRGLMLVLSSPSGAGKTTIARALLERERDLNISISVTTRPKRPAEIEGKDYFFVDETTFQRMLDQEHFLEHARIFGNHYGTLREQVFGALQSGKDIIFDIDWQGTQQLTLYARSDLVNIFILPPTPEELLKRLQQRAQDSKEVIEERMRQASNEMSHWPEYDYVLINDDLAKTVLKVQEILHTERLKRHRQPWLVDFVNTLKDEPQS